jgi:hypothetical protein
MELIGRIRHGNVAELRAYYYSKDEKLLVYDYYSRGSVSNMLHGMVLALDVAFTVLMLNVATESAIFSIV